MTTFLFFMPCPSPVSAPRPPGGQKKTFPSHPGRSFVFSLQEPVLTVMGATFFNLSGLLLKGVGRI
jgi:hypothetical protein